MKNWKKTNWDKNLQVMVAVVDDGGAVFPPSS